MNWILNLKSRSHLILPQEPPDSVTCVVMSVGKLPSKILSFHLHVVSASKINTHQESALSLIRWMRLFVTRSECSKILQSACHNIARGAFSAKAKNTSGNTAQSVTIFAWPVVADPTKTGPVVSCQHWSSVMESTRLTDRMEFSLSLGLIAIDSKVISALLSLRWDSSIHQHVFRDRKTIPRPNSGWTSFNSSVWITWNQFCTGSLTLRWS